MNTDNKSIKNIEKNINIMSMYDPMKEARESMKAIQFHDPMKEIRESMKAIQFHDPMKEIRESLKAYQSVDSLSEVIKSLSDDRWNTKLRSKLDIEFHLNGSIQVDSTLVTQENIQEIAQQVINNALDGRVDVFERQIDRLINEICSLKDPIIQKILVWMIYPIIVGLVLSIVNPIANFYIKNALNNGEQRHIIKHVSKAITSTVNDKSFLGSFKIVVANSLNVRKFGRINSQIMGSLYLGDIVEVIKRGRKWSLITWHDSESNTSVRGWVFSRYIKTIK